MSRVIEGHWIADIELGDVSLIHNRAEVEQERKNAIFDLLEQSYFALAGDESGLYCVRLGVG
ncbi:MAG: hypothetical protein CMM28_10880 [Rhodospirillaceae bacterium]|nr:hypothetical protein [Rhodospirillaceae bacterium]|tara:strand:+ start:305 stop:490 length:186 start_codon:yes stop_codon:yes gene_type:complete